MRKIILASTSPRRKELLEKLRIDFDVDGSNYQEDMNLQMPPLELAKFLSLGKAKEVAGRHKDSVVIGADTFIVFNEKLLGKPDSMGKAKEMLREISGKVLSVITGYTIIDTADNKTISEAVETRAFIKELSDDEIDNYTATGEPIDKAGAFAIQGVGSIFVEKIEGDYFNVMGLPLFALAENLKKFGINVL